MDEIGYIYIPNVCKDGDYCKVLFMFHGCMDGAGWWKDTEARRLGFLEYAATNNIIAVFPQNNDTEVFDIGSGPMDWKYCWTSAPIENNATHPQIQSIQHMYHSLILGSEQTDLVSLASTEASDLALATKLANQQEKEIDRLLNLSKDVLLL